VKHLDVFPSESPEPFSSGPAAGARRYRPAFQGRVLLALWALLLAGFLFLGFSSQAQRTKSGASHVEAPSSGISSANRTTPESPGFAAGEEIRIVDIEIPMGADSPGPVRFSHQNHVDPRHPSCGSCHIGDFRLTREAAKNDSSYLMDAMYEGKSCGKCHNGKDAFAVADDCEACHRSE
jgi:c(7)-type cytochrome triheme protein